MLINMANSGNVNANYVLGNYYYNNSQFGYFRNILIYYSDNNYCSDCRTNEVLSEYNEYSNRYYAKALELSSNKEFKARVTYFMAKNLAFSSTFNGYNNIISSFFLLSNNLLLLSSSSPPLLKKNI